ncbi:MAG: 30S ribosomal protein S1 [Candidatus Limnocylindrales bacterium]
MTAEPMGGTEPSAEALASTETATADTVATSVVDEPAEPLPATSEAMSAEPAEGEARENVAAVVAVEPDAVVAERAPAERASAESAPAETTGESVPAEAPLAPVEVEEAVAASLPESGPTAATEDAVLPAAAADAAEAEAAVEAVAPPRAVPGEPVAEAEEPISVPVMAPPAPRREGPEPTTMEELLSEVPEEIRSLKHGDVVEGSVVRIDKDEILVDIGAKSEGVVSNRELFGRHAEQQPVLNVGDTVLVYVLQPESEAGHAVLSLRRAGLERKWRAMQEQFEAGVIIEAPVIDHNKGGLIVDCGIRGFVPISQIVDFPRRPQNDQPRDAAQEIAEKLQPFVGRKLRLKILEVNRKANRLILSEKVALYEERREKRDELFSSLQVGQKVTGTVRSIAPFGVFIDLGGIDGLVHKSELSWNKVNNPEAGYKVGDEVEAEVIDINHERGRISLSIRRLQPDPWNSTVADFKVGDVIDGTVTKIVNFGAFVRVRDGLEGLIHISELSHQRVAHPGDVVHEGQRLKLKIISLDSERHRLGLSLKQAEEPPARPVGEPRERRGRPERAYDASQAIQEPEGGIDNTLAAAFAQVRQQMAASEAADTDEPTGREAAEEAAAGEAVAEVIATVAADEAAEEAAAAEVVAEIAEAVAADEQAEESAASEAVAEVVATVAADEAALEAAAAEEIDRLEDAAAANDTNEAPAAEAIAEVVVDVAEAEEAEEAAAAEVVAGIAETVAEDESGEEAAATAAVTEVVETVAADEQAEEAAAGEVVAEIVETVAADEAAEDTRPARPAKK